MTLRSMLHKQLATAQRIVTDGHELVPAWRIGTPRTDWVILSRFDQTEPSRQEWVLHHLRRFMAWTFAQSFVVTGYKGLTPTALIPGGSKAIVGVAASRFNRLVLCQPIRREPSLTFGKPESMDCSLIDGAYWDLLPARHETISPEEANELNAVFGVDGELSARWL